ncbi:MAG: TonB-dependent receptor [Spongiibacteraceae bacterium]
MNQKPTHFRRKLNYLPLFGLALSPLIDAPVFAAGAHMEEVIVTARRKEENLQEVPVAVTALTPEALKEKNVREGVDLMYNVPALTIAGSVTSGGGVYNIRGQGSISLNPSPSVTNYFADTVVLGQSGNGVPMYDLQSVQVLKGPQGTLFGRNSIGGAVLVTPVAPGSDFGGFIQVQKGERNLTDVQGAVDLPVNDIVQFRLAGLVNRQDGYTESRFNGDELDDRDNQAWRISMRIKPIEGLENTFIYDGYHSATNGSSPSLIGVTSPSLATTFPLPFAPQLAPAIAGLARFGIITPAQAAAANAALSQPAYGAQLPALLAQAKDDVRKVNPGFDTFAYDRRTNFYNTTTYEISDELSVKNIVSYQKVESGSNADLDGTPFALVDVQQFQNINGREVRSKGQRNHQVTEEIQLQGTSFDDQLDWILGGFYLQVEPDDFGGSITTQFKMPPALASLGLDTSPISDFSQLYEKTKALFGQATYQFSGALDKLSLTAGYRYSWDYRKIDTQKINTNNATISVPALGINPLGLAPGQRYCATEVSVGVVLPPSTPLSECSGSQDLNKKAPSWTVGLDYQLDPDTLIYLAHRHSYRSGGFNSLAPTPDQAAFDPETLSDLELGLKTSFAITDEVQARTNLAIYRGWFDDIQTAQQVVVPSTPPRNLTVTQNVGKADIKGAEAEVSFSFGNVADLSMFYSYTDGEYNDAPNKGRAFVFTPEYTAGATLTVYAPIPEGMGKLSASLTWYEKDDVSFTINDPALNPHGTAPGYDLLNARIDWRGIGGTALDLGVFATNLTDEEYLQSVGFAGESSFGIATGYYGPPRTVGAELRYHFGAARQ